MQLGAAAGEQGAELLAMGGLYEARAVVQRPSSLAELAELFARARASRQRLTLAGGRRSFGEHFLPPPQAQVVDTCAISGGVESLASGDESNVVVRAPGSFSFEALHRAVPSALPWHPPTGDRITLAGALAGCAHDACGYFADGVRSFELLTPRGDLIDCREGASGLGGELFELVPGSFGAFGFIGRVELRLRRLAAGARAVINVLESGAGQGFEYVQRLEQLYREGAYPLGRGLFFFGCGKAAVLLGDELSLAALPGVPPLPLTDDATTRNIVLQGIANRIPSLAHRLQPLVLRKGRRFQASLYGFCFYQRSYDRAYEWLASPRLLSRVLRSAGVDPRLTVCHQTFVVAPDRMQRFLSLYFEELGRSPGAARRLEQQDSVRLPACRWPLHGSHGLTDGCFLFSASFSVRREQPSYVEVRRLLQRVSARAFRELGVKVLLLKQAHCDPALLRSMHQPFIERVREVRRRVDPDNVLASRLLDNLGVT